MCISLQQVICSCYLFNTGVFIFVTSRYLHKVVGFTACIFDQWIHYSSIVYPCLFTLDPKILIHRYSTHFIFIYWSQLFTLGYLIGITRLCYHVHTGCIFLGYLLICITSWIHYLLHMFTVVGHFGNFEVFYLSMCNFSK